MKKFTAKLRDIQETKFPIVKAAFKGKDDQIYIGVMMIDTGSVNCILNKVQSMQQRIQGLFTLIRLQLAFPNDNTMPTHTGQFMLYFLIT